MSSEVKPLLMVSAVEWNPWTIVNTLEDGNITLSGPMGNIITILATLQHFDYKIVSPKVGSWGVLDSSGNWTGMLGMLHRQEVEFAIGPFTISDQRKDACDFSDAVADSSYDILQARPTLQNDMSGFLKPFRFEVWILVLACIVCIYIAMFFVASTEAHIFDLPPINYLSEVFLWVLQTFTQEGSEWIPRNDGGRLVFTTWLLASLVFMSSYSGILTAMLTAPKGPDPIDSLEDLVSQNKMPWHLEMGFIFDYLKKSDGKIQREAFDRSSGIGQNCWELRKEVVGGAYASICEKNSVYNIMDWDFSNSGTCSSYKGRESVYSGGILAMAYQRNSTYLPKANQIINNLKESGLIQKWLGDQLVNVSQCLKPLSSDQAQQINALGIRVLTGPFSLLAGGLCIALLTFIYEVLSDTKQKVSEPRVMFLR